MNLAELFKKQTGLKLAPINMPVDTIYKTDMCDALACTENCRSCWEKHSVKDEKRFKLFEDYSERMKTFKVGVIIDSGKEDVTEDCYGKKIV